MYVYNILTYRPKKKSQRKPKCKPIIYPGINSAEPAFSSPTPPLDSKIIRKVPYIYTYIALPEDFWVLEGQEDQSLLAPFVLVQGLA